MSRYSTLTPLLCLLLLYIAPSLAVYNTTTCSATNYFDTTYLNCEGCQANASPDDDGISCSCNTGYYVKEGTNLVGWKATCLACGTNEAPSADNTRCVACPSTVAGAGAYDSTIGDCKCASGYAAVDIGLDGSVLTTKQCVQCATGAYPGPYGVTRVTACTACPANMKYNTDSATTAWTCECKDDYTIAGDSCILTTDVTSLGSGYQINAARAVTFTDVENVDGSINQYTLSQSDTIVYLYNKAAVGCVKYSDPQSCQVFANLCVLVLYNRRHPLCQLYYNTMTSINAAVDSHQGWMEGLPWLYYTDSSSSIIKNAGIKLTVSFDKDESSSSEVSVFDYYVTKYDIHGNYLGIVPLTNELLACPNSVAAGETLKTFGTPFHSSCDLDLSLFETTEIVFYEMFLKDSDGTMIDIPVKIENYVDESGNTPNVAEDLSTSKFTRRFFVFDSYLGIASIDGFINRDTPAVLQYAKTMRLVTSVTEDKADKINRPYLQIEYRSKRISDFSTNSTSYASFETEFNMDISSFWTVVTVLFIITNVIVGIVSIFRTYVWSRFNPSRFNPENWPILVLFRLILNLMKTWSESMFFFLTIMSGYWFIFYKMQNSVYFLVPDPDSQPKDYKPFKIVFIIMVVFQFLTMLNTIREQVEMDFFFIDWEKPKLTFKREINREVYFQSAWRMILIANEFNELQVLRQYSIELLYMIFGFFMIGLKWEQFAAVIPSMTTHVPDGIERNYILKFFLAVFLFFIIGMILYALRMIITLRFPTPIQQFTDLCAIANISLFVFDKQYHGYYLHGMSPSGQAEGSISELKRALELESKGTVRGRGLLANDPTNLQTYEVFLPWEVRQSFNNLYKSELTQEIYAKQAVQTVNNQPLKLIKKPLPNDFDYAKMEGKRLVIQEHLKLYIEGVRVDSAKLIRDKTPAMRFFDIPPVDIETMQGNPLFYKDRNFGFQNTMFYGNNFTLLVMDTVIYVMWDMIFKNTFVAIFLAYLTNKALAFLRTFFGERNISQKALIDDAFLI